MHLSELAVKGSTTSNEFITDNYDKRFVCLALTKQLLWDDAYTYQDRIVILAFSCRLHQYFSYETNLLIVICFCSTNVSAQYAARRESVLTNYYHIIYSKDKFGYLTSSSYAVVQYLSTKSSLTERSI